MSSPSPGRGCTVSAVALVVLAAFGSYAANLDGYFLKDDLSMSMFTDAEARFRFAPFVDQLLWPKERTWDDIWRPVPAISWAIDYLLFGPDPWVFHFGNLLAHAATSVLAFVLARRFATSHRVFAGTVAGLLFALYPLNVEAVLWSTQRTVVFGLFFSLLAIVAFDRYLSSGRSAPRRLAWAAFLLGLLSREHAAALPAVFAALALFGGPARPFATRCRQLLSVGITGGVLLAAYFGCRHAIFGRFSGGYSGWPTMEQYARDNRVFEEMGTTLRALFVPGNRLRTDQEIGFGVSGDHLVVGLQLAIAAVVLGTLLRSGRGLLVGLRSFVVLVATSVGGWLPVAKVFKVLPSLLNGRSGYHLMAPLVVFAGLGLADAWTARPLSRWRRGFVVVVVLAYAVLLQVNLLSYHGGGRQTRGLQVGVVRDAEAVGRDAVFAVFHVPSEDLGCPTMDAYLRVAVRPPYVRRPLDVVPFVLGLDASWPALVRGDGGLDRLRASGGAGAPLRPVRFLRALTEPPWIVPLYASPLDPGTPGGPALGEPLDGSIVLPSDACPVFRATLPEGARSAVVVAQVEAGIELRLRAPSLGTSKELALSLDAVVPEGQSEKLPWPPWKDRLPNPTALRWRVEVEAGDGSTQRSAERRLVLIEDR